MFNTFFASESIKMGSLVWFLLSCLLFLIDIVSRSLLFSRDIIIIPGFGIHGFANYHFAFSIALPEWAMYCIYFVVMCLVGYYAFKVWSNLSWTERLAWILIISGAMGNLLERVFLGYVRDFLQIGTGYINLGDIYIIFGVLYLLYHNFRYQKAI